MEPPEATIVVALIHKDTANIGWLGDSRVYSIVRGNDGFKASLLTHDHSYVNALVDSGQKTLQEAVKMKECHAITQSLGLVAAGEKIEPSFKELTLTGVVCLVGCSDGFWNYAHPNEYEPPFKIADLYKEVSSHDALEYAESLIAFANNSGGHDNITVAVAMIA